AHRGLQEKGMRVSLPQPRPGRKRPTLFFASPPSLSAPLDTLSQADSRVVPCSRHCSDSTLMNHRVFLLAALVLSFGFQPVAAQVAGVIPRVQKPIVLDGKLDEWAGAFATPVHVGHPDFDNRGGCFLYLWDDDNLYIGLACLDKKPAHVAADNQIYNGDAVEF